MWWRSSRGAEAPLGRPDHVTSRGVGTPQVGDKAAVVGVGRAETHSSRGAGDPVRKAGRGAPAVVD
eukprot:10612998-Heterocapsa_arctica.AAC.1